MWATRDLVSASKPSVEFFTKFSRNDLREKFERT